MKAAVHINHVPRGIEEVFPGKNRHGFGYVFRTAPSGNGENPFAD
jgi:hypothetical protein